MTWTLGQNNDKCARNHAICDGPHTIAKVYGGGYPAGEGWSPDTERTARLIAAAPDLLEALKMFWVAHEPDYVSAMADESTRSSLDDAADAARAAIAKAEGREP